MGIFNNGRCCGRNLVFDLTSGLIPTQDCPPICLTVSKFSNLPDPATDCEFALVEQVSEVGASLQLAQWDGVQWVQITGFGTTSSDYSYNVFEITLNSGYTAIVNGITYDTSDTYNIDPTYYLDITFVSPQGCQYAMDRIGFDPLTTPSLNFVMEDLAAIPFDPNDLSAWNAHLGTDFQYLIVNPVLAGEFILYDPQSPVNIPAGACAGWFIFGVNDSGYNIVESVGAGAFDGVDSNNSGWYFACNPVSVGASAFGAGLGSVNASVISLPRCTDLGGSSGDNGVFLNYTGLTLDCTFNIALQTNNGGNVDGDIQYLIDNNTVTITWVNP